MPQSLFGYVKKNMPMPARYMLKQFALSTSLMIGRPVWHMFQKNKQTNSENSNFEPDKKK